MAGETFPFTTGSDITSHLIVAKADAIVAIGGNANTLVEIGAAWQMDRLIMAYEVEGWSGTIANKKIDNRIRYENIENDKVYGVKTEKGVLELLKYILPKYNK